MKAGTPRIGLRCTEVVALLADYMSGELPPARATALEAHLTRCSACLNYTTTYRTATAATRAAFDGPETIGPVSEELVLSILDLQRREP